MGRQVEPIGKGLIFHMNYSHYNIIRKQKELKSPVGRFFNLLRIWLFRFVLVALVLVLVVGCFSAYGAFQALCDTAPSIDSIDVHPELFSSKVYSADGTPIVELVGSGTNQIYASIDQIPEHIRNCFVAMEDERFYEHNGIDPRGIIRAAYSVIKEADLSYGASTITQQLLKNQVFSGGKEKSKVDMIVRKVQEQYLAVHLEERISKNDILEYYLNSINLGNGSTGIADAAQRYYGKDVEDLTLSEGAVLAPIAYSPQYMNPLRNESCEADNRERRQACLDNMLKNNFCSQEEYEEAVADTDDVYLRIHRHAEIRSTTEQAKYSYFVDALIDQLQADLIKKGYSETEASNLLYRGGLTIYTTQDLKAQEIMDKYFTDESYFPPLMGQGESKVAGKAGSYYELNKSYAMSLVSKDGKHTKHFHVNDLIKYYADFRDTKKIFQHDDKGRTGISVYTIDPETFNTMIDEFVEAKKAAFEEEFGLTESDYRVDEAYRTFTLQPQCAMVIMEQSTGKVIAQYGGRGPKVGNRVLNRASGTYRQAGSTFKVVASFLPAIDAAGFTLASVFDDCYYVYPNTETKVTNWYTNGYRGLCSIRNGIYDSLNIIACQCMQVVTPQVGITYLQRLGFSKIDTDPSDGYSDFNVSIALGGLTVGCSVLEMTAAYAAIGNNGIYTKPRYYTMVYDHDGKLLLDNQPETTQVMMSSTAWLLTDAMIDTTEKGTGSTSKFTRMIVPVAGKTGTVHDNLDLWFAGYTPFYTAAIWSGYDNNFPQENTNYYRKLWRFIMEDVHELKGLPTAKDRPSMREQFYPKPAEIVKARICSKCGNLAVDGLCDAYAGGNCIKEEYFALGTVPVSSCTCHQRIQVCADSGKPASANCPNIVTRVYLRKVESELALQNGGTADTKYVFHETGGVCTIHTGGGGTTPDGGEGGGTTPDGGGGTTETTTDPDAG